MTKIKKKSEPDGDLREQIVGEVENYFAGPRKPDETFTDDPLDYYIAGILLPKTPKWKEKTTTSWERRERPAPKTPPAMTK